jgi:SAM-dependent methyltransferase
LSLHASPWIAADPLGDHHAFESQAAFQRFLGETYPQWARQVQRSLRLMALRGITEPITGLPVAAEDLVVAHANYRETIQHDGCLSRQRAVLLLLQHLMATQQLPSSQDLDVYCPEAVTDFASRLQALFPRFSGSEYLPDSAHAMRQHIPHQDLCQLTFSDSSFDLVIANEIFEHVYDLPAALAEIARILRPGGYLLGTFPFAYDRYTTIVKALHRPGASPGVAAEEELLMEPEFHGNPVDPEKGSLVYQIPGWDLLDQARIAGFAQPVIHWINAPGFGVVSQETPGVMVLAARCS